MPYVPQIVREGVANGENAVSPGTLNYQITRLLVDYLRINGEGYQTYNDMIGALECAKLELYRRRVEPYEEIKIVQNGDVY